MVRHMKYSNLFITGYDSSTEWMLKWFLKNYNKHCKTPIVTYNFDEFKTPIKGDIKNWFKKPFAMIDASRVAKNVCWIDLDCEVMDSIDDIFNQCEPNKLLMAEDKPWTIRRQEKWHNSGVVAFKSRPNILDEWAAAVAYNPKVGDQEVLHSLLQNPLRRISHITDMKRNYNTLRIDLIDSTAPENIKVMHWTGAKGKEHIRGLINE